VELAISLLLLISKFIASIAGDANRLFKTARVYPPPKWPILCRVGR